jgi:ubiquinone/menaquinone biosynthesis C-methylase UbiE
VATDFSPRVLRRDRKWLEFLRLYDQVSLLAFDARRTPFKDGAVETLTTNLGLLNIEEPANLADELRRIVNGTFWAITLFYPEDDQVNSAAISRAKLSTFLFRRSTLERLTSVDWKVEAVNSCKAKIRPTPKSDVLEGAEVDALPVAETTVEWCVLKAHSNTQNCL